MAGGHGDPLILVHSHTAAAERMGYLLVQTENTDIDRDKKSLHTAQGFVNDEWLAVSAGIRVSYEPRFGNEHAAAA